MKKIPHVELSGAEILTPLQMNAIHFDTGEHSDFVADSIGPEAAGSMVSGKADPIKKTIQQ